MRGLTTAGKVISNLTFIIYLIVFGFKTVSAIYGTGGLDPLSPGPMIWNLLESAGYAFVFLVCGMGAILFIAITRHGSEATRCWLVRRSGRPYVIIPEEMARRSIHGLAERMARDLRRGHLVKFEGEVGEWCRDLEGTYRISSPLLSGRRIVTFANANDAFAFKMRWL